MDANLLLLLVVGSTSKEYISKHKRLKAYTVTDFDHLTELVLSVPTVFVTPNTLTETSNLIKYGIRDPARTKIYEVFRYLIQSTDEHYCESRQATTRNEFIRLGLTDSVLLHETANSFTLLTADLDLYLAAVNEGYSALNFNHLRDEWMN